MERLRHLQDEFRHERRVGLRRKAWQRHQRLGARVGSGRRAEEVGWRQRKKRALGAVCEFMGRSIPVNNANSSEFNSN